MITKNKSQQKLLFNKPKIINRASNIYQVAKHRLYLGSQSM